MYVRIASEQLHQIGKLFFCFRYRHDKICIKDNLRNKIVIFIKKKKQLSV